MPVNPGPGFNQVLDVLRSEVITYATDRSGKFTEAPATGAQRRARHGAAQANSSNTSPSPTTR